MENNKKAAIVCSYHVVTGRLSTVPYAFNVLTMLDEAGWTVDVFLAEWQHKDYEGKFSENINFVFFPYIIHLPARLRMPILQYLLGSWKFKNLQIKNYSLVFGLGQVGLYFASLLSRINNSKLVFLNSEFPEIWSHQRLWTEKQVEATQYVHTTIVPDAIRFKPLCEQLPKLKNKPHFELMNIPFPTKNIPIIDWHKRLGIPKDKNIFVHAGGIGEFLMTNELLNSVLCWSEKNILVIRVPCKINKYIRAYIKIPKTNNIVICDDDITIPELDSLIQYASGSFALYKLHTNNTKYIGKSSGKLLRSLALGTPAICSNSPTFNFVNENKLGFFVDDDLNNINSVLEKIIEDNDILRRNIEYYYQNELDYRRQWEDFFVTVNSNA